MQAVYCVPGKRTAFAHNPKESTECLEPSIAPCPPNIMSPCSKPWRKAPLHSGARTRTAQPSLRTGRAVTKTKELGSRGSGSRARPAPRPAGRRPDPGARGSRLQKQGCRTVGSGLPPDFIRATGHFQERVQRQSRELCLRDDAERSRTEGKGDSKVRAGDPAVFTWAPRTQSKHPRKVTAARNPPPK